MEQAYNRETFEHDGRTFSIEYFYDCDTGAPWIENDGHGSIREVRSAYGRPEKKPGEVIMHSDGRHYWLYDVAETTKTARADHWGIGGHNPELTRGQIAAAAVRQDMKYCRGYLRQDWHWCGIVVSMLDRDGEPTGETESIWGMESTDDDGINEYAQYFARCMVGKLRQQWRDALREARARKYWNSRDIVTVGA